MEALLSAVSTVGFPIVAVFALIFIMKYYIDKKEPTDKAQVEAINDMRNEVSKQTEHIDTLIQYLMNEKE